MLCYARGYANFCRQEYRSYTLLYKQLPGIYRCSLELLHLRLVLSRVFLYLMCRVLLVIYDPVLRLQTAGVVSLDLHITKLIVIQHASSPVLQPLLRGFKQMVCSEGPHFVICSFTYILAQRHTYTYVYSNFANSSFPFPMTCFPICTYIKASHASSLVIYTDYSGKRRSIL